MFRYIRGRVLEKGDDYLTVLTDSGLGFKVFEDGLTAVGDQEIGLWLVTVFRQEKFEFYGFREKNASDFFEKLLLVQGMGPKLALKSIKILGLANLNKAILDDDIEILSKIPGVGQKLAKRITNELKNKIEIDEESSNLELFKVLYNLGYSAQEIQKASSKLPSTASLEELIREVLINS